MKTFEIQLRIHHRGSIAAPKRLQIVLSGVLVVRLGRQSLLFDKRQYKITDR